MFTATITKKSFAEGVMQVLVTFSNGTENVAKAFNINSERNLKNEVQNELDRLNELEVFEKTLPVGAYDPSDAPAESLTQEETDKRDWFRNFYKLERLTKLQELGALRPNAVTVLDTLKATVSADFRQAYIADM